ncbi:MAG: NADH-quinone oxidoreductase subunit C [Bacteroidia bacterium]|nr:NADH-quinone oxidoreductase subunit C [Bacteroidia bacterium]
MSFEEIAQWLEEKFGPDVILSRETQGPQPFLVIQPDQIRLVCQELHENERTYFDFLSCLTALDNGPATGTMEVIYTLYSIPYNLHLHLKLLLPRNQEGEPLPEVPSISEIWRTANWHEREAYDLFGIIFTGHPDLRRIFLPADWEGHPLRKDYQHQERYHGVKVAY